MRNAKSVLVQVSVVVAGALFGVLLATGHAPDGLAQEDKATPKVVAPRQYTPELQSKDSERGRRLYEELKCADCHKIAGKGGVAGPPLDGIGARREEWYLIGQIADPQAFTEEFPELKAWEPSYMRHELVSATDVRAIVAYLMTLPEPAGGYSVGRHNPANEPDSASPQGEWKPLGESDLSARGRKLYFDVGCAACHAIGRYGGMFGPRLDGISRRHSRAYISAYVTSPQLIAQHRREGGSLPTVMPPLGLSQAEVEAITEFLLTLPDLGTP